MMPTEQNIENVLTLEIDNMLVLFTRIYPERSSSGFYYIDSNKKYFLKVFKTFRIF